MSRHLRFFLGLAALQFGAPFTRYWRVIYVILARQDTNNVAPSKVFFGSCSPTIWRAIYAILARHLCDLGVLSKFFLDLAQLHIFFVPWCVGFFWRRPRICFRVYPTV